MFWGFFGVCLCFGSEQQLWEQLCVIWRLSCCVSACCVHTTLRLYKISSTLHSGHTSPRGAGSQPRAPWDEECGALGAAQLQTAVSIVQPGLPYLGHAAAPAPHPARFGDCHSEKGELSPMRSHTDRGLHRFTASAQQGRVGLPEFAPANAPAVQKCWVKNRIMGRENHGRVGLGLGLVARSPAQAGSAGAGGPACQEDTTELCPARSRGYLHCWMSPESNKISGLGWSEI